MRGVRKCWSGEEAKILKLGITGRMVIEGMGITLVIFVIKIATHRSLKNICHSYRKIMVT
jgi:hypothetical protein